MSHPADQDGNALTLAVTRKPERRMGTTAGSTILKKAIEGAARRVLRWSDVRIIRSFPMFTPASAGSARDLAALAIQGAEQVFPLLLNLASFQDRGGLEDPVPIARFADNADKRLAAARLKELCDHYGSDKADNNHDHHLIYGALLSERDSITALLEIGLGTNNPRLVSNMGRKGKPGASLRAFRDFLPRARIYGADIDRKILFNENRIQTFFVNQADPASLAILANVINDQFDLIIDDGLHSPNANLAVLCFGLGKLKVDGWLVIEDIRPEALPIWQLAAVILPRQFASRVISAKNGLLFAVQRLS